MIENFRLRVFRTVAQHLNFSRAAEELLLTQPAVTQQIKALEDELGVPLFDRGGGKISLTAGGNALLPFAEKMRTLGEEAMAAVAATAGRSAGVLLLGASQTISQYLLPSFLAGFAKIYPRIQLRVRSGNTDEILDALLSQQIQLALVEGPDLRKDIHIEPFMEDHLVLVVGAAHEWANQDVSLNDLKTQVLLMREPGSGSRRVVEHALSAVGLKMKHLSIGLELDSTEALLSAVEAGLGVTFVSRWAIRNQLALGTLKIARIRELDLSRKFSLAYAAGPAPSGNAASFRSYLHSRAYELNGKPISRESKRRPTSPRP